MRPERRRLLAYTALALLALVAVAGLGRQLETELHAAESWLAAHGAWGLVAFALLYVVVTSLLVPESVLSVAAGALFGLAAALPAVMLAAVAAAFLQYHLGHGLLHRRVDRWLATRPKLAAIQRAVLADELRLQFLLRLTPLNPATMSYLLGATGVRPTGFLVATLALLPHLFFEVYLGYAGRHVVRVAGGGRSAAIEDVALAAGLVATVVVMVVVSRTARRAVAAATGG